MNVILLSNDGNIYFILDMDWYLKVIKYYWMKMVHTHIMINIWTDKTVDDELTIFRTTLDYTDTFGVCNRVAYPLGVPLHTGMTCEHLRGITYWEGCHLSVINALRGNILDGLALKSLKWLIMPRMSNYCFLNLISLNYICDFD